METVNEQKNLETRPENINYKEFWGHSISRNRYLKEKQYIEDHQIEVKERVEWVEKLVYEYLTDQKGCEEVCRLMPFSEAEGLFYFWKNILFDEVRKELFKKGINITVVWIYHLKPFWKRNKTASFEVFATFLQSDSQIDSALARHYADIEPSLGFQIVNILDLKNLSKKKKINNEEPDYIFCEN